MTQKQSDFDEKEIEQLAEMYQYSPFMIREIMVNFPGEYRDLLNAFERPVAPTIRVNTLKATPQQVEKALFKKGFKLNPISWFDYAYEVTSSDNNLQLGATHEYLFGWYYLQNIASMVPVHVLFPEPGDIVLDMCAAPGSKTTQIAQYMKNKGVLIATELKHTRLRTLMSNLRRCGVQNAITFPYDAVDVKKFTSMGVRPNKILLDAPCTGSGIIRTDPTRKRSRSVNDLKTMSELQKTMLKAGLELLAPGGLLVYSTCSFHYQENEAVVADALKKVKGIQLIAPTLDLGLHGFSSIDGHEFGIEMLNCRRLSPLHPNEYSPDAFFYCVFQKN
jgi:NOL1/NOP2/sun family putative RNA methylase